MLSNHHYNLIEQLAQESQSCYRIGRYLDDARDCKECTAFWQQLKTDKEKHIADLSMLIQEHLKTSEGTVDMDKLKKREHAYLAG